MRVLEFFPAYEAITSPVTKFGGQPVWINGAQWPLSRSTGRAMRFICQVALPDSARKGGQQMAYIFFTDPDQNEEYVDGTWESEGGENSVILQPAPFTSVVECRAIENGPSLIAWEDEPRNVMQRLRGLVPRTRRPSEFSVREIEVAEDSKGADTRSRIGGQPAWLQDNETPPDGPWHFIIQIDSAQSGFDLNFGDAGIGYAFIRDDGRAARFLWQCS